MAAAFWKGVVQRQRVEEWEWSLQVSYPELFRPAGTASLLPPGFLLRL